LSDDELKRLLDKSYSTFRHAAIAPLKQCSKGHWVMELFHGPTLAFKDFALQFLGNLMEHILAKHNKYVTVLGATSGDTGSAAIAGCSGSKHMQIVILFPDGRVSDVQRKQMTTVADTNVHCVALDGNFDDCQRIVKTLFVDAAFKAEHPLVAVNSINWVRILAQVVYYFHAALSVGAPAIAPSFSVPTGNFGDVYAGYLAKKMGLPVKDLIIASNRNDILTRCYHTGTYQMDGVAPSLSPSMDIEISSNFERLLFNLNDGDSYTVLALMEGLKQSGSFTLSGNALNALRAEFSAFAVDDARTLEVIKKVYDTTGELLDPHTAVGYEAAELHSKEHPDAAPIITLATAHPAKFPDAVKKAVGVKPVLPAHMQDLFAKPERMTKKPNNPDAIKQLIATL
jgi:threonine synthase